MITKLTDNQFAQLYHTGQVTLAREHLGGQRPAIDDVLLFSGNANYVDAFIRAELRDVGSGSAAAPEYRFASITSKKVTLVHAGLA